MRRMSTSQRGYGLVAGHSFKLTERRIEGADPSVFVSIEHQKILLFARPETH